MTTDDTAPDGAAAEPGGSSRPGLNRRHLLLGGAATGLGALAAAGIQLTGGRPGSGRPAAWDAEPPAEAETTGTGLDTTGVNGTSVVPFYGARQAGIETPAQAHAVFLALDLKPDLTAQRLAALLRLLTEDAAALTQGRPALADTEPELAVQPSRLTVTFGFGPALVALAAPDKAPPWLKPLPAFGIDRLQPEYTGGDLLIQVCGDDPVAVAHARRMLLKDSRSFASLRWVQQGFLHAYGAGPAGATPRNLFGQKDGSGNPRLGSTEFDRVVWGSQDIKPWLENGTSLVIRRIAMNLDTWDELDRRGREESVGRTLASGAPLTGTAEHDEPDFAARGALGFPMIADSSHLRRARPDDARQRIFRRPYNYDDAPAAADSTAGGISNSGQIFVSYQADVDRQFVPIQHRLDQLDILNEWTVPVGSAVFAVPPGVAEGGFIGEQLFS